MKIVKTGPAGVVARIDIVIQGSSVYIFQFLADLIGAIIFGPG